MRLYGRRIQVTCWQPPPAVSGTNYFPTVAADALIITDHRVQFSIEKTNKAEPNKCEVVITNLREDTRKTLTRTPLVVKLDAGYNGSALRHLFRGDLRRADPERTQTERDIKLQLADGDRAYRYARVNKSYIGGVRVLDVVRDAAKTMGLEVTEAAAESAIATLAVKQIASGLTLSGPTRDELTRLLAAYGFSWSVQNGQLQVQRDDEVRQDRAWRITAGTDGNGMIGSPVWNTSEKGERTLTVACLLFPELQPGGKVDIRSEDTNGIFKVSKVGHVGDTHGDDWTTTIECKPTRNA